MHAYADWQIPKEWGPADNQPRNAAYYLSLTVMDWAPVLVGTVAFGEKAKMTIMANQIERFAEIAPNSPLVELQIMIPSLINGTGLWQLERVVEVYGELEPMPPLTRTHVYVLENGQRFGYQFPEPVEVDTEYLELLYSRERATNLQ